mmetsp:Transcript_6075/g.19076  ORF Transcript_6075/g.19076 Transcript_6075/m.19076 type:complete len:263 (+) Transcript_6075:689-1477(+)
MTLVGGGGRSRRSMEKDGGLGGHGEVARCERDAREVEEEEDGHRGRQRLDDRSRKRVREDRGLWVVDDAERKLVEGGEGREAHDEVKAVEGGAERVGQVPVFEGVIGEAGNGQRLRKGRRVRQRRDRQHHEETPRGGGLVGGSDFAQDAIREGVVEAEVKVGREKHAHRDAVQSKGRHRVGGVQDGVEIMSVPIIPGEAEDREPGVGLECVAPRQADGVVRRQGRHEEGLRVQRQREREADAGVREGVEGLVELEKDDAKKG